MDADYPALSAFLRAYLHQDFADAHGCPREAARAYRRAASPADWDALLRDWHRFLRAHRGAGLDEARAHLRDSLGCGWHPRRWHDLARLLPKPSPGSE